MTLSTSQGLFGLNAQSTFQQYVIFNADVTTKVHARLPVALVRLLLESKTPFFHPQIPRNITFEQAATIPMSIGPAAIGLFYQGDKNGSAGLYPPWLDGGRGKYKNEPIFVVGGGGSIGTMGISTALVPSRHHWH